MKSKFFYGVMAVLSLTACSQDEVLDVNRSGDEIKFSVVTNKATRANALYDNSTLPGEFKVWANLANGGAPYFARDVVTIGENGVCTYTNTRYWPEQALNFFAIAGCDKDLTIASDGASASFVYTVNETVDGTAGTQEDVLYAADLGTSKPTDGTGKVTLNFGHALSQIVFKAKVSNPKLHVVVSGVKVAHLNNQGTFAFSQDTGTKWSETETGNYTENNNNPAGSWTNLSGNATYEISCTTPVVLTSEARELESTDDAKKEDAMLLMPQQQNKWTNTTTGTFFVVKCKIYNVAGEAYQEGDVQLYGGIDGEYAFIPAGIEWKPGKKYIYTFNFGNDNGNGGFEPDPNNPDEPDPTNPVLVGITYEVTVDDFDIVSDTPVDVDGK